MKITLPHVGESVTEAVIERWLKQVGDRVEKYEPLAEVVTDKVSMEMPSPVEGVLTDILVDAGQTIPMGAEIAEIATESDEVSSTEDVAPQPAPSPAQPLDRIGTLVKDATNVGPTGSGGPITTGVESSSPRLSGARYSPAVLRLAELHDVDLSAQVCRDGTQRTSHPQGRANVYRLCTDLRRTGAPTVRRGRARPPHGHTPHDRREHEA